MTLNFKKFGEGFPLVILHGLLGSLDNWQTIAKKLAEKFEVFIVDQRNHGKSAHTNEFSYELMANDLLEFFEQQGIKQANVIGHSMGGKTAMLFALSHPEKVNKLILVDITPAQYGDHHSTIFEALFAADAAHATTRQQVSDVLHEKLGDDESTIQFLLKGLNRDEAGQNFEWKFNLEALRKNYSEVAKAIENPRPFSGKTLFVKGENSNYINPETYQSVNTLFPDNELTEIKGAGHWVHADKPAEFIEVVLKFLA